MNKTIFAITLFAITLVACNKEEALQYNSQTKELKWNGVTISRANVEHQDLLDVDINPVDNYLELRLTTAVENDTSFVFPNIDGESFYIPIGGGKLFEANDSLWINHLSGKEYSALQNLSMPFIAVGKANKAIVYIFKNPCRTSLLFSGDTLLSVSIKSDFLDIDSLRESEMRIYSVENNAVSVASAYRKYVMEKNGIVDLTEKSKNNPNVSKLFGAPHFYLWDKSKEAIQMINEMSINGINRAWIGIDEWNENEESRALVDEIGKKGYLIAPYDSYHSIHDPKNVYWKTAQFNNPELYTQAAIIDKSGEFLTGFQNRGRLLNPEFSMEEVRYRTGVMLSTGVHFNSWFIDCDATGEVADDYNPLHRSTKQQSIDARLHRMSYIRDSLQMVIGSENGNDFAASTIHFAHGLDIPVFSWMDLDMRKNRESQYFVGSYYVPQKNEVASKFSKQVPLKQKFYNLFYNPVYSVPLYKIVYNNSVITSNHWEWPSLKVPAAITERMLYEIAYNSAPMYHLSVKEWNKHKNTIIAHAKIWSEFHKQAIVKPMTNFTFLTDDKKVQYTEFGGTIKVVTNYSNVGFNYENQPIPPMSLRIGNGDETIIYTPRI